MALSALGDRAALFTAQRHNVQIRERLATLSGEMATGQAADMAAHLRGDLAPLADLDRRLNEAEAYGRAAAEAGGRLGAMQVALSEAQDARGDLASALITTGASQAADARTAGEAAFARVAGALNASYAGASLFAGTATDGPALAPAAAMLADLRAALAGAATGADAQAALDAWFDDLAGGFATAGYGGDAGTVSRAIDAGEAVSLGVRADDAGLRGLLKAAATAALAPTLDLPEGDARALLDRARDDLLSLSRPLTDLQANLGMSEARAEEAQARHAARATSWGILRAGLTEVDPYETATALKAVETQLETHHALTARLASLSLVRAL